MAHFSVEVSDDRPMGKDYAGETRKQPHAYGELVITDMKDEPYTPTEVVDSPADDSQEQSYQKVMYTDSPSDDALEVKLENGQSIYLQKVEFDRMECYITDIINQLHNIQGSAMVGDIISSYLDIISDQLHHPEEMEHQVAIIYYIIDTNTCPWE